MCAHLSHGRWILLVVLSAAMLAGCRGTGADEPIDDVGPAGDLIVPKGARFVAGGRGQLEWKIPHDGYVYVRDMTAERTLFKTPVQRGQRFTLVPSERRAAVNGVDVFEGELHVRNEHRIYYLLAE